jgi:hypothetical protein
MTGYEEFQMIMADINYKIKNQGKKPTTDESTLEYLKSIFGI